MWVHKIYVFEQQIEMISMYDFEKEKRKLMGRSGKNFKHRG